MPSREIIDNRNRRYNKKWEDRWKKSRLSYIRIYDGFFFQIFLLTKLIFSDEINAKIIKIRIINRKILWFRRQHRFRVQKRRQLEHELQGMLFIRNQLYVDRPNYNNRRSP